MRRGEREYYQAGGRGSAEGRTAGRALGRAVARAGRVKERCERGR